MPTDFSQYTWDEAIGEFLVHVKASRAPKTWRFYDVQLRQLSNWTQENNIAFPSFGKRHMDRYLAFRRESVSPTTLRHDGIAAKVLLKWCARNDFLERSPLAEYEVRNAPRPAKYMPSTDDVTSLINAVGTFWNPEKNPSVRYLPAMKRLFHRTRNYAVILLLLDTACRIGEALSLQLGDFDARQAQISIRESKGREPRVLPMSPDAVQAIEAWLKVRERVMRDAPPGSDEGYLFVSEFGTKIEENKFLKNLKAYIRFASLPEAITLHSLRRYSLNRLAKHNLLAAQAIAGHKDTKTTLIYTKIDPEFLRGIHSEVSVVQGVLHSKREKRRKLV
ncbi:tyrosine-type recombinase/integrase [Armatimonas sp.]|uniref:tyrosine-type recombinase/integrase n=1 Tax=Armatimonas sp. TaxID=1872638 RepID=UPI00374CCB3B